MPSGRVIPIAQAPSAAPGASPPPGGDDSSQTVSLYTSETIYPRSVDGWFARWRWVLVWLTQIVFYGLPWLPWNGRQAMLFDLGARRFYIFDLVLHPQDFIYLTGLLVICAYGLFLFTAIGGRLWCGYACPQTVYTEIFMWVERKIEGDRIARMRLDAAPWSAGKLARKSAKQVAWVAIALWTGFTFVGYFTPIREFGSAMLQLQVGPWEAFWVLFYGFATYGNAGYMREQVCKYMCPYARFQSAMFDRDTLIVSYDPERGEPRGSRPRKADPKALGLGSCIDCGLCVQVCPTGIDIRQGLQYECIGCAACIDVCDGVMDKMNYPRGLIRYATENGMEHHWGRSQMWMRVLRPRVLILSAILGVITLAFIAALVMRSPFKVDVIRDRNTLARLVEDGHIENVYRLQLMNATESPQRFRITVSGIEGAHIRTSASLEAAPTESQTWPVAVRIPPEAVARLKPGSHPITFEIHRLAPAESLGDPEVSVREASTFVVPR